MSLRLRTAAACTHEMRWLAALSAGAAAAAAFFLAMRDLYTGQLVQKKQQRRRMQLQRQQ